MRQMFYANQISCPHKKCISEKFDKTCLLYTVFIRTVTSFIIIIIIIIIKLSLC
jgi:hypothetical protein